MKFSENHSDSKSVSFSNFHTIYPYNSNAHSGLKGASSSVQLLRKLFFNNFYKYLQCIYGRGAVLLSLLLWKHVFRTSILTIVPNSY